MKESIRRRAIELFSIAISHPPDARAPFLAEELAQDIELLSGLVAEWANDEVDSTSAASVDTDRGKKQSELSTLSLLTSDSPGSGDTPVIAPDSHGKRIGDYRLLEEIGRGGMGVVYRARQMSLNRLVALKMILSGQLADESHIRRFYTEAAAAAKLQHRCIVPIHEIGEHEGFHYYSMAYVKGQSLSQLIGESPLPPRRAAELTRQIAEAAQYAHEHGVIHRDIKPGNIMVDENGQPHITDFGLAKRVESTSTLTATGEILGTPSYMPPEQALGKGSQIDPRSDVYALGALLYAQVTGRPPHQAATPVETLQQVIGQDPVSPRKLNTAVDRDLETICLRCLAKEANRRYASAAELAQELDRFLQGKPIVARPVSNAERLRRWVRRNPSVAGLGLTVALALLVGFLTSTFFAVQAHQNLKTSKSALAQTRRTIDNYVGAFANEELLGDRRFTPLLKRLLADAFDYYSEYVNTQRPDPDSLQELASALHFLGIINYQYREIDKSEAAYDEAIIHFRRLAETQPDNPDHAAGLANCYNGLGLLYEATGDKKAEIAAYDQGRQIAVEVIRRYPGHDEALGILSDILTNLGNHYKDYGEPDRAMEAFQQVADFQKKRLIGDPGNHEYRFTLATAGINLGTIHAANGDYEAAEQQYREGISTIEKLSEENVTSNAFLVALGHGRSQLAGALQNQGELDEALEQYESSLEIRTERARNLPHVVEYQSDVGNCRNNIGNVLWYKGDYAGALRQYQHAEETHLNVLQQQTTDPDFQYQLAVSQINVGCTLEKLGKPNEALDKLKAAIAGLRPLVDNVDEPGTTHQRSLGYVLGVLGDHASASDDHKSAIKHYREAVDMLQALADRVPQDSESRHYLREYRVKLQATEDANEQDKTHSP